MGCTIKMVKLVPRIILFISILFLFGCFEHNSNDLHNLIIGEWAAYADQPNYILQIKRDKTWNYIQDYEDEMNLYDTGEWELVSQDIILKGKKKTIYLTIEQNNNVIDLYLDNKNTFPNEYFSRKFYYSVISNKVTYKK